MEAVGGPWPGARHGEVTGPGGERSYRVTTAAALARVSEKTLRKMLHQHDGLATRGRMPGVQGPSPWFVDADRFEAIGATAGWWPPTADAVAIATGDPSRLGEAVRKHVRDLETRVVALQTELDEIRRERDELLGIVASLTRIARRR